MWKWNIHTWIEILISRFELKRMFKIEVQIKIFVLHFKLETQIQKFQVHVNIFIMHTECDCHVRDRTPKFKPQI